MLFPDSLLDLGEGESMPVAYALIGIVALFHIPLGIATIVFFLIWEYRAYKNLSALNAQNLEHSPGWAVGWWFIPFANLVKPF
jgi:heme/copper-type cytochrome/quinol oxidase subunit 2